MIAPILEPLSKTATTNPRSRAGKNSRLPRHGIKKGGFPGLVLPMMYKCCINEHVVSPTGCQSVLILSCGNSLSVAARHPAPSMPP